MPTIHTVGPRRTPRRQRTFAPRLLIAFFVCCNALFFAWPQSAQAWTVEHPQQVDGEEARPTAPRVRSFMVEMDAPPLALIYAQAQQDGARAASLARITQAHLRTVEAAQSELAARLAALDAVELFRVQRAYNGIAVRFDVGQRDAIAALPGVKAVHPLIAKYPTNERSVPYIGAPSLWAGNTPDGVKLTGAGIRVAVIDTGLDYLHTAFGGPGTGYDANDPTVIDDVPNFPGAKVAGGYDFAGETYDADENNSTFQPIPAPDPDPVDGYMPSCYVHGTHVAGTVGGYGVEWGGATYSGPYVGLDFSQFQIGPGVAPQVELYALKIFGCFGSSDLADQAIDWALDPNGDGDLSDHMDVINMSIGSPFGAAYDTSAVASDNAAAMGVIVVASAGNTGDVTYAVGSPAVADRAISVAAVSLPSPPTPGAEARIATFSARGPRTPDSVLKPDLAAPGQGINSAYGGTGDKGLRISGTSMAAPHVAGAAALLRQLYGDWSVEEIKALLMNSANYPVGDFTGTIPPAPFAPQRTGAGVIDLSRAISTTLVAFAEESPGAVSLSFGAAEVAEQATFTRTMWLVNKGVTDTVVSLSYAPINDLPGATVDVAVTTPLTIAAGSRIDVPVRMTAVAADLEHVRDPATAEGQGLPRHWLGEESGFVQIAIHGGDGEPGDNLPPRLLRVPVHAAPRPVADLRADGPLTLDDAMQGAVTLTGSGLAGENPPVDVVSMVSAFELAYRRADAPGPAVGAVVDPLAYGDLRYVGVTSDFTRTQTLDETTLYFGVASVDNWTSPNRLLVNIYVDSDNDGDDDFRLFNSNAVSFDGGGGSSDAFIAVAEKLTNGDLSRKQLLNTLSALSFDTAVYNNSVMVIPARATDIGLGEEDGQFSYRIETVVADDEFEVRDQTPTLVYDARRPGLDLFSHNPTAPLMEAADGTVIRAGVDLPAFIDNQSKGLLLLHHHNARGAHAEVVALGLDLPEQVHLPSVMREGEPVR